MTEKGIDRSEKLRRQSEEYVKAMISTLAAAPGMMGGYMAGEMSGGAEDPLTYGFAGYAAAFTVAYMGLTALQHRSNEEDREVLPDGGQVTATAEEPHPHSQDAYVTGGGGPVTCDYAPSPAQQDTVEMEIEGQKVRVEEREPFLGAAAALDDSEIWEEIREYATA